MGASLWYAQLCWDLAPDTFASCFLCPLASPLLSEDSMGKAERGQTAEEDSGSSGGSQLSEGTLGRWPLPHQPGDLSCEAHISHHQPTANPPAWEATCCPPCRGKDRRLFLHRNVLLTDCFSGTSSWFHVQEQSPQCPPQGTVSCWHCPGAPALLRGNTPVHTESNLG